MLVVVVGLLMQAGSAVAVLVIEDVGVVEALWLRTALAALILVAARPRLLRLPAKGERLPLLALTVSLLGDELQLLRSNQPGAGRDRGGHRVPGAAGVAVAGSRRLLDGLWVVLAAAGIALLAEPSGAATWLGIIFALIAGGCWAAFILSAKLATRNVGSLRGYYVHARRLQSGPDPCVSSPRA